MVSCIAPIVGPWRTVAVDWEGHLDWRIVSSVFPGSEGGVFGVEFLRNGKEDGLLMLNQR